MTLPARDQHRDARIDEIFATKLHVDEPCVFVNCTRSLPDLRAVYPAGIPERALRHAIYQSWKWILDVLAEEPAREIVFAHVHGVIEYVVHARDWLRVHDDRVIFSLNWLPQSHPYQTVIGLSILPALGTPMPTHSAFLYK